MKLPCPPFYMEGILLNEGFLSLLLILKHFFRKLMGLIIMYGSWETAGVSYLIPNYKNIARHTAHNIVSWPKHKQWLIHPLYYTPTNIFSNAKHLIQHSFNHAQSNAVSNPKQRPWNVSPDLACSDDPNLCPIPSGSFMLQ